jgi:hypothetical protein
MGHSAEEEEEERKSDYDSDRFILLAVLKGRQRLLLLF